MNEQKKIDLEAYPDTSAQNMGSFFGQKAAVSKKTPHKAYLLTIPLILYSLFFSSPLQAAKNETADSSPAWYEIELLIFSRVNPDPQHKEYWNQYLKLSFPAKLGVLNKNFNPSTLRYVKVELEEESDTEEINSDSQNTPKTQLMPIYPAFTDLGIKKSKLSFAKNRLKRNGQFKILSHSRWVQPLTDRKNSLPLLFQAGNLYNDQYELEGTVLMSVNRYIHIDSNLWLSSFTKNQTLLDTWWLANDNEQSLAPVLGQSQLTKSNQCTKYFDSNIQKNKIANNQEQSIDYIITQIAQMKQSRRMRSNEIHYLDHPLFGLIVTVKPYKLPVFSIQSKPSIPVAASISQSSMTQPGQP